MPDARLDELTKVSKSEKTVPTVIEFVDIAGLVKDAHKGEGLGNQFLSHIREVDAIAQVVRSFSDKNVVHVAGKVNPASDRETINLELIFADLQTIEKRRDKLIKLSHGNDKEATKALAVVTVVTAALEAGRLANTVTLKPEEEIYLKDLHLLTRKPMLYVLNVDEDKIYDEADYIPISAKIEAEIAELSEDEAKVYLKDLGLTSSGLDKLITAAYKLLDLITFFTSGPMESKAWTIKNGTKAPQAAGVIHTDFEQGFIRAEIINWQDLVESGGEAKVKEKGLLRLEGKDYTMRDGDVAHFRFAK